MVYDPIQGKRLRFNQADTWNTEQYISMAYSTNHCCYCGKPTKSTDKYLRVSRTPDGEWWLVTDDYVPPRNSQEEIDWATVLTLPIGSTCLRKHPEFKFAVVTATAREQKGEK